MSGLPRSVRRAVRASSKQAGRLINRPTGLGGRQVVERLRGTPSLRDAVADRVVMVTGASSGIGEAAARRLGRARATVLLVARSQDKLEALRDEIEQQGGTAHAHPCDLSDIEDIERMGREVLERHGGVDVLVNNAGRSIRRSIHLSYDRFHDFQRTMQLNYFGAVRLILLVLPGMRERRSGHIVNISSAGVQTRVPRFSGYVASKAALDAFSDCIAAEIAEDNVRITTIHMPLVRTPMIGPTKIYRSFPALSPEQAAQRIAQAIVFKPARIGTPFSNLAALANAVSPTTLDVVRTTGYQLFPDSRAARGERRPGGEAKPGEERPGEERDERPSVAGTVFANVMRGVHW